MSGNRWRGAMWNGPAANMLFLALRFTDIPLFIVFFFIFGLQFSQIKIHD